MKVAIVKYNAGNVESVKNALNRLGVEPIVTDDAETLQSADKVIFPGVGEASSAMNYLRERNLDEVIKIAHAAGFGNLSRNAAFVRIFRRKRDRMFGNSAVSSAKFDVRQVENSADRLEQYF